ncbi:LuxR family two component transcriptional regulator [Streptomyces davaonensis JCM 4913]|uniref:LuxR family two component transcriptional regulator n=1 Tax=Streptomyces davaonensis (strain DSM 101723 / JCM 4913 / KCC S-0913 / 768) TaxID=1214101 RepID=K4QVF1_STRDJ|nr:response regulator transcription factor [Streptomyces davaonensis]CCK24907.1 LuxR family two component transcriptional regulator [Streptomyces davaonensis JCM 4913]
MSNDSPVSVVVIDDHPAILAGVEMWYAASPRPIAVIAASGSIGDAWTTPGSTADVIVLDLQLGDSGPAFAALRRLVDAGRQVVVYTMRDDEKTALTCLDLGAATFLTKGEGREHLVEATLAAADNRPYMPPALAGALGTNARADRPQLSAREENVLIEWFQSESKELVAQRLNISVRTVNSYLDRVRIKYANLGRPARTKASLVARAVQDGLIDVDDL